MLLNALLAAYLLVIIPGKNLWASLRPKTDKPERPMMERYWAMSWKPIAMLGALAIVSAESGYSFADLGLGLPLTGPGAWGMLAAVVLLAGLVIASMVHERRLTPEKRAALHEEMLATPMPLPRTSAHVAPFVGSMIIMTAAWEILYRGFVLLALGPYVGLPAAIAISAIAYGVAHGFTSTKKLLLSIVMALLFTGAYALTGSLWWLIVIHAGLPLTGTLSVIRTRPASGH